MATWNLSYDEFDEQEELLRESLCTLGNGYIATRGAAEESSVSEYHYPGTYLAGGYNRLTTTLQGEDIENEDLVNFPDWTFLSFRSPGGEWLDLSKVRIITFEQDLDFKQGELRRTIHFQDREGRESVLKTRRFISMDNQHLGGVKWNLRPLNWSGAIEVQSLLDGSITNHGVKRYRALRSRHLQIREKMDLAGAAVLLTVETTSSQILMSEAARTKLNRPSERKFLEEEKKVGELFTTTVEEGKELEIEKVVTFFTSKDLAIFQPSYEASRLLGFSGTYEELFEAHRHQWERLWNLCDISLCENPHETKLLRLHIFHLLQTLSFKSIELDVGIPSRGLHGEAYRGHIFWDEIYILPFLNLRIPEISRALLMYRYRRLHEARIAAKIAGYEGAMYPWQSGSNGEEESQLIHLNPNSGRWVPDNTFKQRHINATIVYNVWKYYQVTRDREFLFFYGIEMLLEICRFWASLMSFNEARGRYDIKGVVGPDEFHVKYPWREELGIDNNAYTNFMASWCLRTSVGLFRTLARERQGELLKLLRLTEQDLERWEEMSRKIFIPMQEGGIISQFEGFEQLKDLDWDHYRKKYGNIQRIDRILEAEGDSADRYKVNKQADVLMLFYLFSEDELREGFEWLGLHFDDRRIPENINYHMSLSTSGSSLARIVHSWVLARYDPKEAWYWFQRALEMDVSDIQGGTTAEGIHLGAMAGTVDLVQRCFTGIDVKRDMLSIQPHIPEEIQHLELSVRFRAQTVRLRYFCGKLTLKLQRSSMPSMKLLSDGTIYELRQGEQVTIPVREFRGPCKYEPQEGRYL